MEHTTHMGRNRTGMQMSPFDAGAMQNLDPGLSAGDANDIDAFDAVRSRYIEEADGLGSVPAPATLKGMVSTGMSVMTGHDPRLLLDKLGERLAFERTGTRLYDALMVKCNTEPSAMVGTMSLDMVQKIHDDELAHFQLVAEAIESLGGDPTAQTPCADLAGVEAMGLMQVLSDPRTSLTQSLHAILTAELADNVGWEMLVAMAEKHGQKEMAESFRTCMQDEREHLQLVHQWLTEATLGEAMPADIPLSAQSGPPSVRQ